MFRVTVILSAVLLHQAWASIHLVFDVNSPAVVGGNDASAIANGLSGTAGSQENSILKNHAHNFDDLDNTRHHVNSQHTITHTTQISAYTADSDDISDSDSPQKKDEAAKNEDSGGERGSSIQDTMSKLGNVTFKPRK
ncbi:unnamed protein product [Anisakis simplex]|uniref:Secreted protein n=1 Tax=Anisakis simplex TaxID=6269 RepID=A0A0M3K8J0_ANISI|nr:unnamed protein product [Anisakis simplex]